MDRLKLTDRSLASGVFTGDLAILCGAESLIVCYNYPLQSLSSPHVMVLDVSIFGGDDAGPWHEYDVLLMTEALLVRSNV